MANFMREVLNTLSYDPAPAARGVDAAALDRLDQRLSGLAPGANTRTMLKLRPQDCMVWDGNPRRVDALNADNCRSLIESIALEGGNRIPVLVRANPTGSALPYELLVGSRRRFSVDWLNHNGRPELSLNALIVDLTDEEAFRLADIENREREDITELDRARSYQAAVDRFYAGVQSRMAQALALSNSQLSRLLSLAQMPEEVVDAFATREDLRVRHSEVLTPLLRRPETRERIILAAVEIGAEQQLRASRNERMVSAATVLSRLRGAVAHVEDRESGANIMIAGTSIGRVKSLKSGDLAVELAIGRDIEIDSLLDELRGALEAVRRDEPLYAA